MEQDLAASIAYSNKNNVWISDNMVSTCHHCKREFTLFVRKHHCRSCGNIFCYKCTDKYIVIPNFITDRPNPADYWNISYYITSLRAEKERVCDQCYNIIVEKKKIYDKIVSIFENPRTIDDIVNMPDSDMDMNTKYYYFDYLRNIQYYLPNHRYNDIDRNLLMINSRYFSKHSKYIVHLIKSIDWKFSKSNRLSRSYVSSFDMMQTISECSNLILNVLNGEKIISCNKLYCTRTCREQLSCDDCVNILFSCANDLPDQLLKYFFDIIMKTPEQIILCHLSFFVSLVKNSSRKLLHYLSYQLLCQSKKIIYHTYWFLNNARDNSNEVELENINKFIKLFDHEMVKKMQCEYMFFVGLINNLDDPKRYLANTFDNFKTISLPYEPNIQLVGVDLENIVIKNSYTKPTIITFETSAGKISLLFKKESIMNDVIVLNLMTLCDIILNENLNTNFGVVVYPAMPLTSESGMIGIVDNAETIYTIVKNKKSLLQYIIEKNENQVIKDVLDRYMYSLVSYTLHSYFIGLGDRHLQNVMITDNGMIFHIDFGFILGTDVYPLTTPDIKLNSGMLDVIGNQKDERYRSYLELCAKGTIILRKYFNMFYILLSQNSKLEEKQIEKFIMSRFQPRQRDEDVISELINIIQQSNNTLMGDIRDFLHYHTQEKTIQQGVSKVIKTALDTIKNLAASNS